MIKRSLRVRLWRTVDSSGGVYACWPTNLALTSGGYTRIRDETGRSIGAHVAAYILVYGPVPKGKIVCHSCDDTICCNPWHLWAGTYSENTRDMLSKGHGGLTIFSYEIADQLRLEYPSSGLNVKQFAELHNTSANNMSDILNERKWMK